MHKSITLALFASVCIVGSAEATGIPTSDGFPSPNERAMLTLSNAARQAPQDWCSKCNDDCSNYPSTSRAPLRYDEKLNRASRFHARHLHDTPCFQHNSCCTLGIVDGEVECTSPPDPSCNSCLANNCPGTGFSTRASLFGASASGENIAAGNHGAQSTVCQWLRSPGHRNNLLGHHSAMGPGHYSGHACYNSYWVQKFGGGSSSHPIAAAGLIDNRWYAANYHSSVPGVQKAVVVEDGVCRDLTLEWGEESNGTWILDPAGAGQGCRSYWFLFIDEAGNRHYYPSEGALGFGAGCPEYMVSRPDADCINCLDGQTQPCYEGPTGTEGVGECRAGTQTCSGGSFGACVGQVLPTEELCDGRDHSCNGIIDYGCPTEPDDSNHSNGSEQTDESEPTDENHMPDDSDHTNGSDQPDDNNQSDDSDYSNGSDLPDDNNQSDDSGYSDENNQQEETDQSESHDQTYENENQGNEEGFPDELHIESYGVGCSTGPLNNSSKRSDSTTALFLLIGVALLLRPNTRRISSTRPRMTSSATT